MKTLTLSLKKQWFVKIKSGIGTGRQEWGAEPGTFYYVITWEE